MFPFLHTPLSLIRQETQYEAGQGGDMVLFPTDLEDSRRAFENEELVALKQLVLQEYWAVRRALDVNGAVAIEVPGFAALSPKLIL